MRYLAQIEGKPRAEAFVAFLLTQAIPTQLEEVANKDDSWDVWIRDEDSLEKARSELQNFVVNPDDPKYAAAVPEARQIARQQREAIRAATKNIRQVNYKRPTAMPGGRIPPITLGLLVVCVIISLLTNFAEARNDQFARLMLDRLSFVSPTAFVESQGDPGASLKRGEIWRAITPIFVHGSPLHLAMNMMGLVVLGRLAERLVGTPRYALMVLILGALPMMLACLMPMEWDGSPRTYGISGLVYGLAAFLWLLSSNRPELGFQIPNSFIVLMLVVIALGFMNVIGGLSNWGHLGGFVTGLALAAMNPVR